MAWQTEMEEEKVEKRGRDRGVRQNLHQITEGEAGSNANARKQPASKAISAYT